MLSGFPVSAALPAVNFVVDSAATGAGCLGTGGHTFPDGRGNGETLLLFLLISTGANPLVPAISNVQVTSAYDGNTVPVLLQSQYDSILSENIAYNLYYILNPATVSAASDAVTIAWSCPVGTLTGFSGMSYEFVDGNFPVLRGGVPADTTTSTLGTTRSMTVNVNDEPHPEEHATIGIVFSEEISNLVEGPGWGPGTSGNTFLNDIGFRWATWIPGSEATTNTVSWTGATDGKFTRIMTIEIQNLDELSKRDGGAYNLESSGDNQRRFDRIMTKDPRGGCKLGSFRDTSPSAGLAILYLWSWGDGTTSSTFAPLANHTYLEEKVYRVYVRVQYRNGAVEIYTFQTDTRAANCYISEFVQDWFPVLLGLMGLCLISALIVARSRHSKSAKKNLSTMFMLVAGGCLAIVIVVAIYTTIAGIPV